MTDFIPSPSRIAPPSQAAQVRAKHQAAAAGMPLHQYGYTCAACASEWKCRENLRAGLPLECEIETEEVPG